MDNLNLCTLSVLVSRVREDRCSVQMFCTDVRVREDRVLTRVLSLVQLATVVSS